MKTDFSATGKNPNILKRIHEYRSGKVSQSKRYTRSKVGNVFYVVVLVAMGLFSILPLVYCLATSLKPLDELMLFPPKFFVSRPTMQNYFALPGLLSNLRVPLSRYIFNSLFVTIITTVLYVIFSTMAAFVLTKSHIKGRKLMFRLIQYALLFNAFTLAIPQYLIFAYMDIIDTYWVYILPYFASTMGVFLMKQYMDGYVPDALIEAAHIDGADWFGIFGRIIVPIIKPCILTLTLFTFLGLWNVQSTGTIFSEQLKTLPTVMSTIAAGGLARTGSSMATSVIMMIPPILVYLISQSSIKETMGSAGIKG